MLLCWLILSFYKFLPSRPEGLSSGFNSENRLAVALSGCRSVRSNDGYCKRKNPIKRECAPYILTHENTNTVFLVSIRIIYLITVPAEAGNKPELLFQKQGLR
jgi:hypothetical protein